MTNHIWNTAQVVVTPPPLARLVWTRDSVVLTPLWDAPRRHAGDFNPNHDELGRFAEGRSAGGAAVGEKRDEPGAELASGTKAKSGQTGPIPAKPGQAAIPEGHVRLYHQTRAAELEQIAREGILLSKARGIEGPKAIYADEKGFYGQPEHTNTVEFHVPREDWDRPFVRRDSVPVENIVAIHRPWHAHARYIEENPEILAQVLAGEHDSLLDDADYGPALRYIKERHGAARKAADAFGGVPAVPVVPRPEIAPAAAAGPPAADYNPYHDDIGRFTFGPEGGGGGGAAASGARQMRPAPKDRNEWPEHARGLKVPPAWTNVAINTDPNADLLVTGEDAKGRKQYVYSQRFIDTQSEAKFQRIKDLSGQFDKFLADNEALRRSDTPDVRAHADVTALIAHTGIRPGSDSDTGGAARAYGATTLEGRHVVRTDSGKTYLRFTGKSGVRLSIPVTDPGLADMLHRRAQAGPRERLFPEVSPGSLLGHVSGLAGGGFKTKDMRTLLGTTTAIEAISGMRAPKDLKSYKKAVKQVAVRVAKRLGNTAAVALRSYIDPSVFAPWRMQAAV